MKHFLGAAALALLFGTQASAQFADEASFNQAQAKKLDAYASKALKKGFPRQAKKIWLMLISEYDADSPEAHDALGMDKAGNTWVPRTNFKFPDEDSADPGAAKSLRSEWETLAKALGAAHRTLAQQYEKAGRDDRARYHFERVIRYVNDDAAAKAALDYKPVESLSGTDLEKTVYERSKIVERAVAEQDKIDYPVEVLPDTDHSEFLDRAQVPHRSVKSEHFLYRGDFEIDVLKKAAVYAERALRVVNAAFAGSEGYRTDLAQWPVAEELFVSKKETYQQVLDANADRYPGDKDQFKFSRDEASGTTLVTASNARVGLNSTGDETTMYDSAVRDVAQRCANFESAALTEGIGHTVVGMFFGNNRLFMIDRQRQMQTSTEDEIAFNSPNFDEWKDLAVTEAWKKTGTPAAELTLFRADKFPNEARIKAWSFCDYVVRRDPALLQKLDELNPAKGVRNPVDIAEKFAANNDGLTIAQLEKEWRDFWTEASPVYKAIRNNTPPLDAVSKDVDEWLKAFNAARKAARAPDVTWSSTYSSRCAEHTQYLAANKKERGAAAEQMQNTDLEGATHLGDMFAQMALVSTEAKDPKDLLTKWLDWPGYRDALLNSFLWTVGIYAEKGILVMDVIRGVRNDSKEEGAGYTFYPREIQAVPTQVEVADLGPELEKLLADNGHTGKKVIGYPISFHGFKGLPGDRNSYRCQVSAGDQPVEGLLHVGAAGGTNRRTSAPGMVVFYPLEPLKRGTQYGVAWSFTRDRDSQRVTGHFTTK